MNDIALTGVAILYIPMIVALVLWLQRRRRPRQFAACLVSVLCVMTSLLVLQYVNKRVGWWLFFGGGAFFGMPLEVYLGWAVLWGLVPQLAFPRLPIPWCAAVMIAVDIVAMPMCNAMITLRQDWLVGEALAVMIALVPALCISRWTLEDTHLQIRAALHVAMAGMLFLFLLPEIVFALRPGRGWSPLLQMPSWSRQLGLQAVLLLAVPGISAVMEFAERGGGTPIPYDPPKRLVRSGIYRYIANPMQLSCGIVMLVWAMMLDNGWLVLAAVMSTIYSAGIAEWDEGQDMERRFGAEWKDYRARVRNWIPRWRPYDGGPVARLYIAGSCGPCSELRNWLEAREPLGLEMVAAETLPARSIQRIRYDPGDGSRPVEGIRALGRAMEHLHLGWALAGTTLRLPGVWHAIQLLMDASGFGPRQVGDLGR